MSDALPDHSARTTENAPWEINQIGGVALSLWMTGANVTDCEIVARMDEEIRALRLGFCDEAHILAVQALDVKALPKGRKRVLTEQAVRMAKVGLGLGRPRSSDRGTERRAATVLGEFAGLAVAIEEVDDER